MKEKQNRPIWPLALALSLLGCMLLGIAACAQTIPEASGEGLLSIQITKDFDYQLIDPDDSDKTLHCPRTKYLTVNSKAGTVTAKKLTLAKRPEIVTIEGKDGITEVAVYIVANKYSRKAPLVQSGEAVFSSSFKLYYKSNALYADIFLHNQTGGDIHGSKDMAVVIYDGDEVIHERALNTAWMRPTKQLLRDGAYTVRTVKITEADMPGSKARAFDLPAGTLQVVLTGTTMEGFPILPVVNEAFAHGMDLAQADILTMEFAGEAAQTDGASMMEFSLDEAIFSTGK